MDYKKFLYDKKLQILTVIVLAFIVRLYYFVISSGQVLWWDEAEYMATAKYWALDVPYDINEQRPPLFQLLAAILLKVGFGELSLKFLLVLLPSVLMVLITYYLGKELYDYKIGILSAALTAFVWSILFWSVRFQPDFISLTFQLCALLFFWKLIKSNSSKHAVYAGVFAALGFYFKISALLVPLSMFLFVLYYDGFKFIKNKKYWIIFASFLVALIPFMVWQAISFGNPLAFGETYSGDFNEGRSLGWMTFDYYYSFAKLPVFILFLAGVAIAIVKFGLTLDLAAKDKAIRKDPSVFSLIVLLVITLFYIFYIKGVIEDRWVLLMIPFMFFFAAKTVILAYDYIVSKSKIIAIVLVCLLFAFFIYSQLNHTTDLVNNKISSYMPIKEASLIIKGNSLPTDKILSVSYTQTTAYAEREVITYAKMSMENFTKVLREEKPRFIIASILEPHHPDFIVQQVQNEEGYQGIRFAYFNSTIVFSPDGQIVQYDVKNKVISDGAVFTLIYPYDNTFGGLVAYKIDYIE